MSIKVPTVMESSWKHYLLSLQFQSVQANPIAIHTQKIAQYCEAPTDPLITQLNDHRFWENLIQAETYDKQAMDLKNEWLKISPLVHLNSQQLLILLEEEIEPLERAYQLLEFELAGFSDNKERVAGDWILRIRRSKNEINEKITENTACLKELKRIVYDSLLFRASVYKKDRLDKPRNVDDVLSYFCLKINAFDSMKQKPLTMPQTLSASLNDDRRLEIYDILMNANFDKEMLDKEVAYPITRLLHKVALSSRSKVEAQLSEVKKFCQGIIKELNLNGHGAHLFSFSHHIQALFSQPFWGKDIFKKIGHQLEKWGLLSLVGALWHFRYLFMLFASLAIYHQLVSLLQPFIIATMGVGLFNTISTALFYTLGVAPLWYLGWTVMEDLGIETINLLTRWKKQTILHALGFIEEVEFFMCAKLQQTIVDLPHFDMGYILKKVEEFQAQSAQIEQNLGTFHLWEKWAAKGALNEKIEVVKRKLHSQREIIDNHLAKMAEHIADEVGKELDLLRASLLENQLEPHMPKEQLHNLKEFVQKYGTEKVQAKFEKNTNISEKWLEQIKKNQFVVNANSTCNYLQPWGVYNIREDALKGWKIFLEASLLSPTKKAAALQLNDLLIGKKEMTEEQYTECISTLDLKDSNEITSAIGSYLFQTLSDRTPQHAALLPLNFKKHIFEWHLANKEEIDKAQKQIDIILFTAQKRPDELTAEFESLDDATLGKYYELLDAKAICVHGCGLPVDQETNNKVRTYFENYSGEHSRAYRLLKLVPDNEKNNIRIQLAQKRATYLLNNFRSGTTIDQIDIELFGSFPVQKKNGFSFSDMIRNNENFHGTWDSTFEAFLGEVCKKILTNNKLLEEYQAKMKRQKDYILRKESETITNTVSAECENKPIIQPDLDSLEGSPVRLAM